MIGLIDTGISNLGSVKRWIKTSMNDFIIIQNENDFKKVDLVIFPGVGSFDSVIKYLKKSGIGEHLKFYIENGGKYLGICLGFQVLFSASDEGELEGLNIFSDKINKLNLTIDVTLPHVGFNEVVFKLNEDIFTSLNLKSFYFTHSYGLLNFNESTNSVVGKTEYEGLEIITFIKQNNIVACQFHPEKSSSDGIQFLKNLIEWSKKD